MTHLLLFCCCFGPLRSIFSFDKLSTFLVHGFGDNTNITKLHLVKNALFETKVSNANLLFFFKFLLFSHYVQNSQENINLFMVDWGQGAALPDYPKAASNVVFTGLKIASFILNSNISPLNVHCIGHSLGQLYCYWPSNKKNTVVLPIRSKLDQK